MRCVRSTVAPILAALLTVAGCKKNENPVTPPEPMVHELFPMGVGASWTYRVLHHTSDSSLVDTLNRSLLVVNQRDTTVGGQRWTLTSDGQAYSQQADGVYADAGYPFTGRGELLYKFPAEIGDRYTQSRVPLTARVIATHATVTVPAGTFTCLVYELTHPNTSVINRVSIARDVGVVRREQLEEDVYTSIRYVSISYDLLNHFGGASGTVRPKVIQASARASR